MICIDPVYVSSCSRPDIHFLLSKKLLQNNFRAANQVRELHALPALPALLVLQCACPELLLILPHLQSPCIHTLKQLPLHKAFVSVALVSCPPNPYTHNTTHQNSCSPSCKGGALLLGCRSGSLPDGNTTWSLLLLSRCWLSQTCIPKQLQAQRCNLLLLLPLMVPRPMRHSCCLKLHQHLVLIKLPCLLQQLPQQLHMSHQLLGQLHQAQSHQAGKEGLGLLRRQLLPLATWLGVSCLIISLIAVVRTLKAL